ncbi:hypothetical protein QAD02_005967 [Eretmocerus hayati]|uniref:Uncharacterized protein n=1 Tax=Eretmocerus hayati TaxID=131215 RepID=A0ACC2N3P9_9HYME|nr:hypothetical protein QAD02_005967 [Eretmocerus hayati]
MKFHTEEYPFTCDVCDEKFRDVSQLVTHARTHANDETYSCGLCGAKFQNQLRLKNHAQVHSRDRLFECKFCGNFHKSERHLKSHLNTHLNSDEGKQVPSNSRYDVVFEDGSSSVLQQPHEIQEFRQMESFESEYWSSD